MKAPRSLQHVMNELSLFSSRPVTTQADFFGDLVRVEDRLNRVRAISRLEELDQARKALTLQAPVRRALERQAEALEAVYRAAGDGARLQRIIADPRTLAGARELAQRLLRSSSVT